MTKLRRLPANERTLSLLVRTGPFVLIGIQLSISVLAAGAAAAQSGRQDTAFGYEGLAQTHLGNGSGGIRSVALEADGKILVVGNSTNVVGKSEFTLARYNSDGSLDSSFGIGGFVATNFGNCLTCVGGTAMALKLLDDRILVAGVVRESSGGSIIIARYTRDGTPDIEFGDDGILHTTAQTPTEAMLIQNDGSLLVAGGLWPESGISVARILANGELDPSFGGDGSVVVAFPGVVDVKSITLQSNGRILVAGGSGNDTRDFAVVRLKTNGDLDSTFGDSGAVATDFGGTFDLAYAVAVQSNGKILLAGQSGLKFAVARYDVDGSLDENFDGDGKVITDFGGDESSAWAIAVQSDQKIVAAGDVSGGGPSSHFAVARYKVDGSLDPAFGESGKTNPGTNAIGNGATALAIEADGRLIIAGGPSAPFLTTHFTVMRLDVNAGLDETFDEDGIATTDVGVTDDVATSLAVQQDGKIVIGAYGALLTSSPAPFVYGCAVLRYQPDGSLDTSFSGDGKAVRQRFTLGACTPAVGIQSDDRIVVSDTVFSTPTRYNSDGSEDAGFGGQSTVLRERAVATSNAAGSSSVAIDKQDRIVVVGSTGGLSSEFAIARYNADGTSDLSFGDDGTLTTNVGVGADFATSVAIQADNRIVVGGYGGGDFKVVRYQDDGNLDMDFGNSGRVVVDVSGHLDIATSIALQADQKILLAGYAVSGGGEDGRFAVTRYLSDGRLDVAFGDEGKLMTAVGTDVAIAASMAVQEDGRIVVAGQGSGAVLVRYEPDGTLDTSFGTSGQIASTFSASVDGVNAVAIDHGGGILVAGGLASDGSGGDSRVFLARFLSEDAVCGDASGNGIIQAGDALIALQTAVGLADCGLSVCDVDGSGTTTAGDALAILRVAVGLSIQLHCVI